MYWPWRFYAGAFFCHSLPILCNKLQKKVGEMFGRLVNTTIFDASNHKQNPKQ